MLSKILFSVILAFGISLTAAANEKKLEQSEVPQRPGHLGQDAIVRKLSFPHWGQDSARITGLLIILTA